MFDIPFNLRLHLLMFLRLPSLLVELLFELFYLVGDFLLASKDFFKLGFFAQKIPSAVLNFIPNLLRVLKVHLFNLAVSGLNIVAKLIGDGFFAHQGGAHIE